MQNIYIYKYILALASSSKNRIYSKDLGELQRGAGGAGTLGTRTAEKPGRMEAGASEQSQWRLNEAPASSFFTAHGKSPLDHQMPAP